MGISTLSSYQGAQVFEAIGIGRGVVQRYFQGTASRIGGSARDRGERRRGARVPRGRAGAGEGELDDGGVYAWRATGEAHLWNPKTVASLQKAVRLEDAAAYAEYARAINDQSSRPVTLRGLWDFTSTEPPVPLDEVEPASALVRRFSTGAMSFGSISKEAHENLAIAMNRIGGKSNSGEGGEDSARFVRGADGESRRSAIKQVASRALRRHDALPRERRRAADQDRAGGEAGRRGADPGPKVDGAIARVRHATPGVTLISPRPTTTFTRSKISPSSSSTSGRCTRARASA